jgi:tetratricopeptide (TPR) repeat protein
LVFLQHLVLSAGNDAAKSGDWHVDVYLDSQKLLTEQFTLEASAIQLDSAGWYNKGNDLLHLDKYDEAIQAYNKAIEIDPQYAYAWNNEGFALL